MLIHSAAKSHRQLFLLRVTFAEFTSTLNVLIPMREIIDVTKHLGSSKRRSVVAVKGEGNFCLKIFSSGELRLVDKSFEKTKISISFESFLPFLSIFVWDVSDEVEVYTKVTHAAKQPVEGEN